MAECLQALSGRPVSGGRGGSAACEAFSPRAPRAWRFAKDARPPAWCWGRAARPGWAAVCSDCTAARGCGLQRAAAAAHQVSRLDLTVHFQRPGDCPSCLIPTTRCLFRASAEASTSKRVSTATSRSWSAKDGTARLCGLQPPVHATVCNCNCRHPTPKLAPAPEGFGISMQSE